MRYIIYFLLFIPVIFTIKIFPSGSAAHSISTSIFAGLILFHIDAILINWRKFVILFWQIKYWNTDVRLSISYLFQIKCEDRYLLVKSKRRNSYQPPGGVYKRLPDSEILFKKIRALDDSLIPVDTHSVGDLRILLKGKYLISFFKWFESEEGREVSPWREFYEELVNTKILSPQNFPYIYWRFLRRHWSGIRHSNFTNGPELLVADIFELLPTANQADELNKLSSSSSAEYIWADAETIQRNGVVPKKCLDATIGDHTKWIL
jgi:hypothetical protein